MRESEVTSDLCKYLTEQKAGVLIKHADQATLGIPDLSITGAHVTTWCEIKYVDYIKPVAFNLRKIVGWQGPQFRTMARLDYHGSGALYAIFFHQPRKRLWNTFICTGVQCSGYCNEDYEIDLGHYQPHLYDGKAFGQIWAEMQKRRKEIAGL